MNDAHIKSTNCHGMLILNLKFSDSAAWVLVEIKYTLRSEARSTRKYDLRNLMSPTFQQTNKTHMKCQVTKSYFREVCVPLVTFVTAVLFLFLVTFTTYFIAT